VLARHPGLAMAGKQWWLRHVLRGTDTMLGQVRSLFLGFCLLWPLFGLWGITSTVSAETLLITVGATLALETWLYLGYRRQRFPAWSWAMEGLGVCLVAGASNFGATVGLAFMWINLRALYGPLREKLFGGAVVSAMMLAGVLVFDARPTGIFALLLTALLALAVNHVLARGSSARDRSAIRERAIASVGAGLVAASSRKEAVDVTLAAALSMDEEVGAAVIVTAAGPALHVIAAAGRVDKDAMGWVAELSGLPAEARETLRPGGYAQLTGAHADAVIRLLRFEPHSVVVLAPLTAHGSAFGLLILALNKQPVDDLSAAVTTLADEVALTLDQLLSRSRLTVIFEHSPDALMLAGETGSIRFVNRAAEALLGCPRAKLIDRDLWSLLHVDDLAHVLAPAAGQAQQANRPCRVRGDDGREWIEVEAVVERVIEHDGSRSLIFNARDISDRQRLELELRHAQKLESVGRLAAGIAHEINTPIQFVGDNVRFLESAFADLNRLCDAYRELAVTVDTPAGSAAALQHVEAVAKDVDIDFVLEEVPLAISQTLDGIHRVANIVRAMKAFGHPGTEAKTRADLNEAIEHTLIVANNEIKYVADVETDLAELPLVQCHLGDINQVVLNLVVNAAHAIGSADRGRGTIRVSTHLDEGQVIIKIADTGTGVPADIADKLFDPFFTTKEVGTGTGQGLALVRALVADRHGGSIDFTSEAGVGTVFTVRLPVNDLANPRDTHELTEAVT
jgi:PAS domain S-box-containing protein